MSENNNEQNLPTQNPEQNLANQQSNAINTENLAANEQQVSESNLNPPQKAPLPTPIPPLNGSSQINSFEAVNASPLSSTTNTSAPPYGGYPPNPQPPQPQYTGYIPLAPQQNYSGYRPPIQPAPYGRPTTDDQQPYEPLAFSYQAPPPKEKHVYSSAEKLILPLVFVLAFFFDRLVLANFFSGHSAFFVSIFSMIFMVAYYIFQWEKVKNDKFLWFISALVFLLCTWNLIFDYRSDFGAITLLVIPGIIMAHVQLVKNELQIKDVLALFVNWILGWGFQPFSALHHYTGANNAVFRPIDDNRKHLAKRILIGLAISIPALCIILPLLASADKVFGYYLKNFFEHIDILSIIWHLFLIIVFAGFIYSFFWNQKYGKRDYSPSFEPKAKLDTVIVSVVFSVILIIYLLFCWVQFAYLFAGSGLPAGLTYSEYAREGFFQICLVAGINLAIFGVVLTFTRKNKILTGMLGGLLAITVVMLCSGVLRLSLYVQKYMLTWLRLLSFWFLLFLFLAVVYCIVRLFKEKFPTCGVMVVSLLVWFVVLGYSNPDALIIKYNLSHSNNPQGWIEEHSSYIRYSMSDNSRLAILEEGYELPEIIKDSSESLAITGNSYTSYRLSNKLNSQNS